MVKPIKYLRKLAAKAEGVAVRMNDPEISAEMHAMAEAYRSQAEILKKKRPGKKKSAQKPGRRG